MEFLIDFFFFNLFRILSCRYAITNVKNFVSFLITEQQVCRGICRFPFTCAIQFFLYFSMEYVLFRQKLCQGNRKRKFPITENTTAVICTLTQKVLSLKQRKIYIINLNSHNSLIRTDSLRPSVAFNLYQEIIEKPSNQTEFNYELKIVLFNKMKCVNNVSLLRCRYEL